MHKLISLAVVDSLNLNSNRVKTQVGANYRSGLWLYGYECTRIAENSARGSKLKRQTREDSLKRVSTASTLTATELKLRLVLIIEVVYGFMVTSVHELQRIRHVHAFDV